MEWYSGNFSEARKVFNTALMMCNEMFFDEKDRREALAPLVRLVLTVCMISLYICYRSIDS